MKRGAPEHPKTLALARRIAPELGVPMFVAKLAAAGLLERLFHFTAAHAPHGDLAVHESGTVALGIGWENEPEPLIEALVATHWLERTAAGRLLVVNWSKHCEDSVHAALFREVAFFADGSRPKPKKVDQREREQLEARYAAAAGMPPAAGEIPPAAAGSRNAPPGGLALASASASSLREEEEPRAPAACGAARIPRAGSNRPKAETSPEVIAAADRLRDAVARRFPGADVSRARSHWPRELAKIKSPETLAVLDWFVSRRLDDGARIPQEPLYLPTIESAAAFRKKFDKLVAARMRDPMARAAVEPPAESETAIAVRLEAAASEHAAGASDPVLARMEYFEALEGKARGREKKVAGELGRRARDAVMQREQRDWQPRRVAAGGAV